MGEVDLWLWALDVDAARRAELSRHLSEAEHRRARRYRRRQDQVHFEAARGRMREILAGYVGTSPGALPFTTNAYGKPQLADGPAFNLSHAGGWAALAVSAHGEVGIDIEPFRPVEAGLAERFFSPAEAAALAALPPEQRQAGFFRCWTRKEAFVKALGTGLSTPLHAFDVSLVPNAPAAVLSVRLPARTAVDWRLTHLDLGAAFVGALATRGPARLNLRQGALPLPGL